MHCMYDKRKTVPREPNWFRLPIVFIQQKGKPIHRLHERGYLTFEQWKKDRTVAPKRNARIKPRRCKIYAVPWMMHITMRWRRGEVSIDPCMVRSMPHFIYSSYSSNAGTKHPLQGVRRRADANQRETIPPMNVFISSFRVFIQYQYYYYCKLF